MKIIALKFNKIKKLAAKKRFICFAAGKTLNDICIEYNIENNIDFIADNNKSLWDKEIRLGNSKKVVKIINPDKINELYTKNHVLIITTPYHMQVTDQLYELKNDNIIEVYYFPVASDYTAGFYKKLYKNRPLKNIISFRSGALLYVKDLDFTDNARVLFEYMLKNGYNKNYKLVWYVKYPNKYKNYFKNHNVVFVSYDWVESFNPYKKFLYWYFLFNSKFFFFTDTAFWTRYCYHDQIRVNLWHGCGFKDRKNKLANNGKSYEIMTVTSSVYAKIHARAFGLNDNQVIITGLAKQDLLFNPPKQELDELLKIKKTKKNIFWLPTFRMAVSCLSALNEYYLPSEIGLPIIMNDSQMRELDDKLNEFNISLIIKLHPVQDNSVISHNIYKNIYIMDNSVILEKNLLINTLLSKADALISDYSSAAVDYMLLDRPIAFTLDDAEDYKKSRDFVFENLLDWLPGKEIYTFSDFIEFINEINEDIDSSADKRRKLLKDMHTYQDGNNCKRILDYFKI